MHNHKPKAIAGIFIENSFCPCDSTLVQYMLWPWICLSLSHKLVFYQNNWMDWAGFRHRGDSLLILHHYPTITTVLRPFIPGQPRWAGASRQLPLDFMVLGRITRGRHTNNPGGHHSFRTNQQSTSINPPFLRRMPFLPQPSQFILAWDRHRNMLDCIPPWLGYTLMATLCYKENLAYSKIRMLHSGTLSQTDLSWFWFFWLFLPRHIDHCKCCQLGLL